MNTQKLFTLFNRAITWNAGAYAAYKLVTITTTYILSARLSATDFATWASLQSMVYLLLLWFSFGLRKAIPQYARLFAADHFFRRRFIISILIFKAIILSIGVAFFWYAIPSLGAWLGICCPEHRVTASILLCLEGILSVIQLLYHSYFLNREFNTIATSTLLAGAAYNLFHIYRGLTGNLLISWIMSGYCLSTLAAIIISLIFLSVRLARPLPLESPRITEAIPSRRTLVTQFIYHSLFMGTITIARSLTQRNFMFLFFTAYFGVQTGRLFKLTNDSAQLLHRIVIKMIGVSDTALLAHAEHQNNRTTLLTQAFNKLTRTIAFVSIPLTTLLIITAHWRITPDRPLLMELFIPIAIAYQIDLLLLPYERILEVTRSYRLLLRSLIPFPLVFIFLFLVPLNTPTLTFAIAHGARTASLTYIVFAAKRITPLVYPWRQVIILLFACTASAILIFTSLR